MPRPGILAPPPSAGRPRWIHQAAWALSLVSLGILVAAIFLPAHGSDSILPMVDLVLAVLFVLEFLTRSGLRQYGWKYVAWRWFDFPAMFPILWFETVGWLENPFWFWLVFIARLGRAVDRTLGDGFFLRQLSALVEGIEEEISDRVTIQILERVEKELADARFGHVAAAALRKNRDAVLKRIYEEQMGDKGLMSTLAQATGLQAALEKAEARIFDSIIDVVGSKETDEMIRDIIVQTLGRARAEMGEKSWRSNLGFGKRRPAKGKSPA